MGFAKDPGDEKLLRKQIMKTIQVTDEQYEFFKDIAEKMGIQNNRHTQYPLFYVQQEVEIWVDGDAEADRIAFVGDDGEVTSVEDSDEHLWKKVEGDWESEWHCEELNETIDSYEACERFGLRQIHLKIDYVDVTDVGPFLTEDAANRHMQSNAHHYTKPRTYVYSCWRNHEMQELLRLIFCFKEAEVPSQYK